MIKGLLRKTIRETWLWTAVVALALLGFQLLLAAVLPRFAKEIFETFLKMEFVQRLLASLLGADVNEIGVEAVSSVAWVHPVVLALTWAHAIAFCTRLPAGEVDRGPIDVLLGVPVSRWRLHAAETAVWLAAGVLIVACNGVGRWLGLVLFVEERTTTDGMVVMVSLNFLCLYLAVGGFSWLVSSWSDRRGRAILAALVFVLVSFLLNSLAPFHEIIRALSVVSVMRYYRPLQIIGVPQLPIGHMAVLSGGALVMWLAGLWIFLRRDIRTT